MVETPSISVLLPTYRPGVDLTFPSLSLQTIREPFELVLTDELYGQRHDALMNFAKTWKIRLNHVRAEPHPYISVANTFNSGIEKCNGEFTIICGDYTWLPPNYLEEYWKHYKTDPMTILNPACVDHHALPFRDKIDPAGFTAFKEPFNPAIIHDTRTVARFEERLRFVTKWVTPTRGIMPLEWIAGLIGVETETLRRLNGFDIIFSGGRGFSDHDLDYRLSHLGYRFVTDFGLVVHRIVQDTPIFADKKAFRTVDDNRAIRERKHFLLDKGFLTVDSHRGLRDLRKKADRRFIMEGGGSGEFARKVCASLRSYGINIVHTESSLNLSQTTDYVVYGVSPGDIERCFNFAGRFRCWLWWTGTDVVNLVTGKYGYPSSLFAKFPNIYHLCLHPTQQRALTSVNIDAQVVTDVPTLYQPAPLPEEPAVLVYSPSSRPDVYKLEQTMATVRALSDVKFIFYGNREPMKDAPPNVEDVGWVTDMEALYRRASCLLRLTTHDGFPASIYEIKQMGRHVVCSHPYEYCMRVSDDEAADALELALRKGLDAEGQDHYLKHYTPSTSARQFAAVTMDV